MKIINAWRHFCTIQHHKNLVMAGCFRIGLYRQGLMHDLSKYGPTEFLVGCKYYRGYMSPNNAEREDKGYTSAWLHHKGRNKHHLEYWIDYSASKQRGKDGEKMIGMKMPVNYVCEMFIDRVSASKNYQKEDYTDESPLKYYEKSRDHYIIHPDTAALLEYLLTMLAVKGEKYTYTFVKYRVLRGNVPYEQKYLDKCLRSLQREQKSVK